MYVALDQGYLEKLQFDELYTMAGGARAKIGAFIKYLVEYGRKSDRANGAKPACVRARPVTSQPSTGNAERGTLNGEC